MALVGNGKTLTHTAQQSGFGTDWHREKPAVSTKL